MLNKKLFKKLNEQMEINEIKNKEATKEEVELMETKVIFENVNAERLEKLNLEEE